SQMKQIDKPVQFALVPFAASVNIAPSTDDKPWMDTMGISPIHHENFDWSKMTKAASASFGNRWAEKVGDAWVKRGAGWGDSETAYLTRFSLYSDMLTESDREEIPGSRKCIKFKKNGTCDTYSADYEYIT